MLAVPWLQPFDDPEWWFELKWDGIRVLMEGDRDRVRLRSRRDRDMTATYPELAGYRFDRPTVLDGEIVVLDHQGRPSFAKLQQRMNLSGRAAVEAARTLPATLVAFDLLHHGEALVSDPIEKRRERLQAVLPAPAQLSEPMRGEGRALFAAIVERGLEGMVAKLSGSMYRPGRRSPEWRKIAHRRRVRAVVGGFTLGERARATSFGALELGLWVGERLRYVGGVGSGFDDRSLRMIRAELDLLRTDVPVFTDPSQLPRGTVMVVPRLQAVVEFRNWTPAGRLRAPVFVGFAEDGPERPSWETEGPG